MIATVQKTVNAVGPSERRLDFAKACANAPRLDDSGHRPAGRGRPRNLRRARVSRPPDAVARYLQTTYLVGDRHASRSAAKRVGRTYISLEKVISATSVSIRSERTIPLIAYVLHLFVAVTGLISIAALILNYVRSRQYGEASHHRWMIRTFWWTVLWLVVGWLTRFIGIGWVICVAAWCWYVYRHIRGLVALANGEEMPA